MGQKTRHKQLFTPAQSQDNSAKRLCLADFSFPEDELFQPTAAADGPIVFLRSFCGGRGLGLGALFKGKAAL